MNTWRDIKTDPPMPDEPVLFTDGSSIFIGRIYHVDKPAVWGTYSCRGYSIDGDYSLEGDISLFDISEWQPVPDIWKPEKSADEMFREIGYEKMPFSDDEGIFAKYENETGTLRVMVGEDGECYFTEYEEPTFASKGEILACAQLIREMEANNE